MSAICLAISQARTALAEAVPFGMATSLAFEAVDEGAESAMDNNTIFNDLEANE
jgi:hypothetical protein